MSNRRILGFALLAASVLSWLVLAHFLGWLVVQAGIEDRVLLGAFATSDLVAVLPAAALGAWAWKSARSHAFLIDVVDELSKVVWPTRQETQDSTVVVVATVVLVSLILWAFDLVWLEFSNLILFSV